MPNNKINSDAPELLRSFLATQLWDAGYLGVISQGLSDWMEFRLRPATIDDIDFMYQLRKKTMKPIFTNSLGWNETEEQHNAATHLNETKIASFNNQRIGVMKVIPENGHLHLHQIQILPEFQGNGIGEELVQQVITQSQKEKKEITLFVVKNTPAKNLYERNGFVVIEDYEHHCKMSRLPNRSNN